MSNSANDRRLARLGSDAQAEYGLLMGGEAEARTRSVQVQDVILYRNRTDKALHLPK
jgi:hypothetical protein